MVGQQLIDLKQLGIGLSRFLRYTYGGLLFVVVAASLAPDKTKNIIDTMGAGLTALAAVVLGAGIYTFHRAVVIPIHHLVLCGIFRLRDWNKVADDVLSPTRYIGLKVRVKRFWRIAAYTCMREKDFLGDRKELRIRHAEGGLLVMTSEVFLIGAVGCLLLGRWSWSDPRFLLFLLTLGASYTWAVGQHSRECQRLKQANVNEVREHLRACGIPMEETPHLAEDIAGTVSQ